MLVDISVQSNVDSPVSSGEQINYIIMGVISVILFFFVSILTIVYAYFKYSFGYWKSRGVPCDEPLFPYGNVKGLGKTVHLRDISKRMYDKYKPTGAKCCGFYVFTYPILLLLDLELIKRVCVKDFANFNERNLFSNEADDPLTGNLLQLDGEKWKKLRAKLTPTFSTSKMRFMFSTVLEVAERLRDCLFELVQQNDQLDIGDLMARFTTDVIGTCAFGIECNSLRDPNAEFRYYGLKTFKALPNPLWRIFLGNFRYFAQKLHVKVIPADISSFFMNVIRDTIEYREKNNVHRNDFMDILIALKNQKSNATEEAITFNELAAQAFIFFLAGFETTSTTLTFCLHELAINPDIQTKARRVIQEAYQKHNGQFTYEMLMDMPYIDQILEETLRKHAPGVVLSRRAIADYRIPETSLIIEKGTDIMIPVHAIHHNPKYYPNPERFDPDRFGSEEKKKRNPMNWLAFGEGPRNCIGLRFALMKTRIALVILLKNFEFSVGSKTTVPIVTSKSSLLLSPQDNVYLNVKKLVK